MTWTARKSRPEPGLSSGLSVTARIGGSAHAGPAWEPATLPSRNLGRREGHRLDGHRVKPGARVPRAWRGLIFGLVYVSALGSTAGQGLPPSTADDERGPGWTVNLAPGEMDSCGHRERAPRAEIVRHRAAPRPGRRHRRTGPALELRRGRRPRQPHQDAQKTDVWTRQPRPAPPPRPAIRLTSAGPSRNQCQSPHWAAVDTPAVPAPAAPTTA